METSNNTILFCVSEINSMCMRAVEENSIPHMHDFYSIFWIRKGEAIHATSYIEYTIKPSTLFFVPAGLLHKMILSKDCEGYSILFNKEFFTKHNADLNILNSLLFNNPDFYTIVNLESTNNDKYLQLVQEMIADDELMHTHIENEHIQLHRLIILLLESIKLHKIQYLNAHKENSQAQVNNQLIQFKKLIDDNFIMNKEVSYYADIMNISAIALNELSKKYTSLTAGELIRNRVIDEIKKMIYSTTLSDKEIAFAVGFTDPGYFSRFFKKYTNYTLTEYRQLLEKKVH